MDLISFQDSCATAQCLPCQQERALPTSSACSVFVQHVDSDGSLWVMLQHETQIMEVIQYALNSGPRADTVVNPSLNEAVAALNTDDVRYRAIVKKTEPKITVQFIDFGDYLEVPSENLFHLPPTLSIIPPLAMKVKLPADSKVEPRVGTLLLVKHLFTMGSNVIVDTVLPQMDHSHVSTNMGSSSATEGERTTEVTVPCMESNLPLSEKDTDASSCGQEDQEKNICVSSCGTSSVPSLIVSDKSGSDVETTDDLFEPVPKIDQWVSYTPVSNSSPAILDAEEVLTGEVEVSAMSPAVLEITEHPSKRETHDSELITEELKSSESSPASDNQEIVKEEVVTPVTLNSSPEVTIEEPVVPVAITLADSSYEDEMSKKLCVMEPITTQIDVEVESKMDPVKVLDDTPVEKVIPVVEPEVIDTSSGTGEQTSSLQNSLPFRKAEERLNPNKSVSGSMQHEKRKSTLEEYNGQAAFDPFISALGRYPHLGGGYGQVTSSGYTDVGAAGDFKGNQRGDGPRMITKGRSTQSSQPPRNHSPQYNSRPVLSKPPSSAKIGPQTNMTPASPSDFKTILEFELSIIREQNRLQMLQLQKKMEQNLTSHMKTVKEEMSKQLAAFRNEVNGRLMVINDSVVHKMADIYSDLTLLKNEQEMKSEKSGGMGGNHFQSSQPHHNLQSFNGASRHSPDNLNPGRNQSQYSDNFQGIGNLDREFQPRPVNQYHSSENYYERESNDNSHSKSLLAQRKEKMTERDSQKQQSSFPVGQFNYNDYPKVDHFDPSKTGLELDSETNNKRTSGPIVCVNNLCAEKINPDLLFNLFGVYGNVQKVKMSHQDKGRAYIEMGDSTQAEEVVRNLNNVPLMGQRLHVTKCCFEKLVVTKQEYQSNTFKDFTKTQVARIKPNRFTFFKYDASKLSPPGHKLLLMNVLNSVTDEKVREEFSKRGFQIQNIHNQVTSNSEKKLVFITFGSTEEAVNALTEMHLQELSDWMMMRITFAK